MLLCPARGVGHAGAVGDVQSYGLGPDRLRGYRGGTRVAGGENHGVAEFG